MNSPSGQDFNQLRPTWLVLLVLLLVTSGACLWSLYFWQPAPEWDPSPEQIIFRIDPGGEVDIRWNDIPELRIWGDGRIVLVRQRIVMEGRLSEQQLQNVIRSFIDAGWFRNIHRLTDKDYALDHLIIVLSETSRGRYIDPEDKAVYALIEFLRAGAGAQVHAVVPTSGRLYVMPVAGTSYEAEITKADFSWPDTAHDLEGILRENRNGIEISGPELELAWKISTSRQAVVESKGELYLICVEVEGISR